MIKITPCTVVLKGEISNRDQNSWVILTVKAGHFNMRVCGDWLVFRAGIASVGFGTSALDSFFNPSGL